MQDAVPSQSERLPEFGSGLLSHLRRQQDPVPADAPPPPQAVASAAPPAEPALDDEARLLLAARVEEHAESIWAVFADALAATTADGRPDHRTRMLAARSLLAEAFLPAPARPGKRSRVKDELAELRRRRAARPA